MTPAREPLDTAGWPKAAQINKSGGSRQNVSLRIKWDIGPVMVWTTVLKATRKPPAIRVHGECNAFDKLRPGVATIFGHVTRGGQSLGSNTPSFGCHPASAGDRSLHWRITCMNPLGKKEHRRR